MSTLADFYIVVGKMYMHFYLLPTVESRSGSLIMIEAVKVAICRACQVSVDRITSLPDDTVIGSEAERALSVLKSLVQQLGIPTPP